MIKINQFRVNKALSDVENDSTYAGRLIEKFYPQSLYKIRNWFIDTKLSNHTWRINNI